MIQVIQRAGSILRALEPYAGGRSVGEVAAEVGLPRSSVHRILKSLEGEGLVVSVSDERGFRLGPAFMRMASSASAWLTDHAHPLIAQLSAEIDETVDLAVRSGTSAHFIDQVAAGNRLRAVSAVGLSFPLHCTANGKALLAQLDDRAITELLGQHLERLTPHTITDLGALLRELGEVRRSGLAFDREEHHLGISAVGTTVDNQYGLAVAVSVPVPTSRFAEREEYLCDRLLTGREQIAARLAQR